jgi:hypothetical protein
VPSRHSMVLRFYYMEYYTTCTVELTGTELAHQTRAVVGRGIS